MHRRINEKGLNLIKSFERCILKVYDDGYGYKTFGWGHLVKPGEVFQPTQEEANRLLRQDLYGAERSVLRLINQRLTDNQFSALVSFVFNCGGGALQRSVLRQRLNRGDYDVANEFLKWNKVKGKMSRGLTRRRVAEMVLFMSGG